MTVNTLLVRSYAVNIYLTGKNSFANIGVTRPEYVEPVKQYAADNYYIEHIDDALKSGWITPEEHAETLALKGPEDPQNVPPFTLLSAETKTE